MPAFSKPPVHTNVLCGVPTLCSDNNLEPPGFGVMNVLYEGGRGSSLAVPVCFAVLNHPWLGLLFL